MVIGLTGGIGTGKSRVSEMFQGLGARVVDADILAREIVQPGKSAWKEIKNAFGPKVLNPDKTLNRQTLANMVFTESQALERLNQITHPRVYRKITAEILKAKKERLPAIVLDIPLLLENPPSLPLDMIIVVYSPKYLQAKRIRKRDGLTIKEAEQRLRNQMPIAQKKRLADYVIDNRGSWEETRRQVRVLWDRLIKKNKPGKLPTCS